MEAVIGTIPGDPGSFLFGGNAVRDTLEFVAAYGKARSDRI